MGFWVKIDSQAVPHHPLPKAALSKNPEQVEMMAVVYLSPTTLAFVPTRLRKPD